MKIMHKLAFLLTLSLLRLSSLQAATWTVNTSLDNNLGNTTNRTGSLRFCIDNAASGDDIVFAASTDGNPVLLTNGVLNIVNKSLTIKGNGPDLTIIDGNSSSQIIKVGSTLMPTYFDLNIIGMTLRNGFTSLNQLGAGIDFDGDNLFIENCKFYGNQEASVAMRDRTSSPSIFHLKDSQVYNNSGSFYSGIFCKGGATRNSRFLMENSSIYGNQGFVSGLGILQADTEITNSTISGNSGVAILFSGINASSELTIVSSTIIENQSSYIASAVFMGQAGTAYLSNSIVANNIFNNQNRDIQLDGSTSMSSGGFNIIGNGTNISNFSPHSTDQFGTTSNPLDPELTPLGNYGGSNPTHLPLCSSPALNMGDPSIVGLDQRGQPRTGTINGGQPDIGATEFQWPVFDGAALQKVCKGTCNRVEIVPSADLGYWSGISTSFSTSLFGHVPNPTGIYTACVPVSNQDLTVFFNMMDQNGCQFQSELDFQVKPKCDGFMDICCNFGGNGNSSNKVFNVGELSLIAYPNPSTDGIVKLKLDGEFDLEAFTENSMQLQALDIDGQIALEITVTTQELKSGTAVLDVSNLPKGLYHLHLVNDQISGEVSTKIIW